MDKKTDYNSFQSEIIKREIMCLVHFTETINLLSILENKKIYSRAQLEELKIEHQDLLDFIEFNDKIRLDELRDYINLSISFPNHYLFSKFREKMNSPYINWCVIKIDPKYIYEKNTLFAVTNAASNSARHQYQISGDFNKFKLLFKDELEITSTVNTKRPNRRNLKDKYPTDVQAEVLVKNQINYNDIIEICFQDKESMAAAKAACSGCDISKFCLDDIMFGSNRE